MSETKSAGHTACDMCAKKRNVSVASLCETHKLEYENWLEEEVKKFPPPRPDQLAEKDAIIKKLREAYVYDARVFAEVTGQKDAIIAELEDANRKIGRQLLEHSELVNKRGAIIADLVAALKQMRCHCPDIAISCVRCAALQRAEAAK